MRTTAWAATWMVAAGLGLGGCGGGSEGTAPPELPALMQGKSILFPTDGTLNYLSGYDSVGGTVYTTPCMKPVADILKDVSANPYANLYDYKMQMVESKSQLYDFLNASYQTEVKYVVGKNQTAVDMANQFKHESQSVYVVVKSTWDGPVFSVRDPAFAEAKDAFLAEYPTYDRFVNECGDSFALSLQSGMHFYAMFKFTFSSTSERNQVHAKLYNKTLAVKTTTEFNNQMGFDSSRSSVEVTARIVGGTADALDISRVRTVGDFFAFVDQYAEAEKTAIRNGKADGLQKPDPGLAYGYAVRAVVVPYKPYLKKQYGLPESWFSDELGDSWSNLEPLARLYTSQIDAYNQLDFIVRNPVLFGSTEAPGKSLTNNEINVLARYRDKFKASASEDDKTRGLQALMLLCSSPDAKQTIRTGGIEYSDVSTGFNGTARKYCRALYADDPASAGDCDGLAICEAIYDKLDGTAERARLPFFTFDTVASRGLDVPDAIVDANQNTVLSLPVLMTSVPQDCAALKNASPNTLADGDYTVYFMGKADQPYTVYCKDMGTASAKTYLSISEAYVNERIVNNVQTPAYNFSMRANGDANAHLVAAAYRTWQKYRLASSADGVAIDMSDLTYSWSYNPQSLHWWSMDGAFVSFTENLAPSVHSNLELTGTGLAIRKDNILAFRGWGAAKPSVQFHSYLDASKRAYIEGMTTFMPIFAGESRVQNPGAANSIWLEYVPDAANNNKGTGALSGSKTVPVTPHGSSGWCNDWGPTCAPAFLISVQQLFGS